MTKFVTLQPHTISVSRKLLKVGKIRQSAQFVYISTTYLFNLMSNVSSEACQTMAKTMTTMWFFFSLFLPGVSRLSIDLLCVSSLVVVKVASAAVTAAGAASASAAAAAPWLSLRVLL